MYVALLVGSIVSALAFGAFLVNFTPGRLIQVIQGSAVVTVILNFVATWKQEARRPAHLREGPPPVEPTFRESWDAFIVQNQAMRRLVAVGLGTLAFTMEDILLEPFGGQVLGLGVRRDDEADRGPLPAAAWSALRWPHGCSAGGRIPSGWPATAP